MTPVRIQRKRTKGWVLPDNTVCVDRSSRFGNPYKVIKNRFIDGAVEWWVENSCHAWRRSSKRDAQELSVRLFKNMPLKQRGYTDDYIKQKLRGKNLACWCKECDPCHADVLLEMANS